MAKEFWPNGATEYTEQLKDNDYLGGYETSSIVPGNKQRKISLLKLRTWLASIFIGKKDNVAALETAAVLFDGRTVQVLGFDTINDGGQGEFVWVASSTATPVQGLIVQVIGVATGRWFRLHTGIINAKQLGVKNDASVDCSSVVNAAAPYCDVIRFDEGGYLLEGQIDVDDTVLNGAGRYLTYFVVDFGEGTNDFNNAAVKLNSQAEIHNIGFIYPNQNNTTGSAILYPPSISIDGYYSKIKNIALLNSYYGIYVDGGASEIEDVIGYPLWRGLYVFFARDIPKISKIHWNPNVMWNYTGVGGGDTDTPGPYGYTNFKANMTTWVGNNGTAYQFGRCDFSHIINLFAYGYFYGLYIKTDTLGSANAMWFINCHIDVTAQPVRIQNWEESLSFIGCKLVGRGTAPSGYDDNNGAITIVGGGAAGEYYQLIKFIDCTMDNYQRYALSNNAVYHLIIRDTIIRNANQLDGGFSLIDDASTPDPDEPHGSISVIGGSIDFDGITDANCRALNKVDEGYVLFDNVKITRKTNASNLINAPLAYVYTKNMELEGANFPQVKSVEGNYLPIYRQMQGYSAPTIGTYTTGDEVINSRPDVGEHEKWRCILGGSPGTWEGVGQTGIISNTTSQRPDALGVVISDGYIYRDTTLNKLIIYYSGSWYEIADSSLPV